MGASPSRLSSPRSNGRKVHHGAVHSGSHYVSPASPMKKVPSHTQFDSADFDNNLELKQSLPDDLKIYCNSIEILYRFWCTEIDALDENRYNEVSILFYVNVFKLLPEARVLFKTKNIELQSKQFFGMFRWIITNLREPDADRLIKRIKSLGPMHRKMNIKPEWFELFLQAFHNTMDDAVKQQYTARVRFCMEQLYTVVMNIMLDKDFESLSSAKIAKLLKSLDKLEDCLQDEEATLYLELYMKQQFCVELILFYKDYRRFKESMSDNQRQQIGEEIMKKYIGKAAECEVNLSNTTKSAITESLKENNNQFNEAMFDKACKEVVNLMRRNVWHDFKYSIMRMATDEDKEYEARMSTKNLSIPICLTSPSTVKSASSNSPSFSDTK